MLEQNVHLKRLLIVLAAILTGVIIFSAFSLYRMKMVEMPAPSISDGQAEESPEDGIYKQLKAFGEGNDGPNEKEIEAQLEALRKNADESDVPTEEDIRKQLDTLNQQ